MLVNEEVPKNNLDPIYKYYRKDFTGNSFLLHPDVLLYNAYKYSTRDVAIYASLASVRSYARYLVDGTITLDLREAPVNPRDYLDNWGLITVAENNVLHFLYERTPPLSQQH